MKSKIIYALLALIVITQFGLKGYIFTLDWVPVVSHIEILKAFYGFKSSIYGGTLPLQLLNLILPAWLFQRMVIFLVLFLSGISADTLAGRFVKSDIARLYAGLLYMINPFTYIRLLVGHWIILFSYALLPLGVHTFLNILERRNLNSSLEFAFVQTLIGFNAHMLLISFILYIIILGIERRFTKWLPASFVLFFLLSTYWVIPLMTCKGSTLLAHITLRDLKVFAPKGSLFNLMAMYGFWKPGYLYAKDFLYPYWMYIFLIIFSLSIVGFICSNRKDIALAFALIWIIGFALASGIKGPFSNLMKFLFEKTILKGMRDSQKFVAMLVLSYSILGAVGLEYIGRRWRKIAPLLLIIPLIYSFTFFNCFAGQIHPCDFPKDWYKVKAFLDKDCDEFRVLFFPWHLYMTFHWVEDRNKLIANPAPLFFDKEVISAKNIEIPGVYTEIYTPYQVYVMDLLKNKSRIHNLGRFVAVMGVKYILLTKEVDYKNYFFLFNQSDLKLVMKTKNFYVFRNLDFKGLAFSLNKSNTTIAKIRIINPAKILVYYKGKTLIMTWEYSPYWTLNGIKPFKAYGVVCGFNSKGRIFVYERFYKVYLPAYIISSISALVLICWRWKEWCCSSH